MSQYWPDPNPLGKPKQCTNCGELIDGNELEGWWLEKEEWQLPNTYHLFCLPCCAEKMTEWPNHPDVDSEATVKELLYE